jgi:heat shock protein HslJ
MIRATRASLASLATLLLLAGCATVDLPDGEWNLTSFQGQKSPKGADNKRLTIQFEDNGRRVFGFAGCNRFSGTYRQNGTTLELGPLVSTKMACAGQMELESAYLQSLGAVNRWETKGGHSTLVLTTRKGEMIEFKRPSR